LDGFFSHRPSQKPPGQGRQGRSVVWACRDMVQIKDKEILLAFVPAPLC
jgi:hypothetical protein